MDKNQDISGLTEMYERALIFATQKHRGQMREDGFPYISHSIEVSAKVNTLIEKIVSLLHDTIEDTDTTREELLRVGFYDFIVDAVCVLSKKEGEAYDIYIRRVSKNKLATSVKIADIEHNLHSLEMANISEKEKERRKIKWKQARKHILSPVSLPDYIWHVVS